MVTTIFQYDAVCNTERRHRDISTIVVSYTHVGGYCRIMQGHTSRLNSVFVSILRRDLNALALCWPKIKIGLGA